MSMGQQGAAGLRGSDLMWRGVRAWDMGVIVTDPAPLMRPGLRVETETVPGKSGSVDVSLWPDVYEDISLAPGLVIRPGYSREAVAEWLTGSGRLILGNHPMDAYEGRVVDEVEIKEGVPGHPDSYATLKPCFVCRPWKYEAIPAPPVPILHGGRGYNPRSGVAAPLIRIRGRAGASLTITCGDQTLTATLEAAEAVIDCDWEAATGCRTGGDFLRLTPLATWQATVKVTGGTVSSVTMDPGYRSI